MAFDTKEFGFNDLKIVIAGRPIIGLRGLKIKTSLEMEDITGQGGKTVSRGFGEEKAEGELTLLGSEFNALETYALQTKNLSSIHKLVFDIPIVVGSSLSSGFVRYLATGCQIKEREFEMAAGQQYQEYTLPLAVATFKRITNTI